MVEKILSFYQRIDEKSGGWLSIFRQSGSRFIEMRGAEAAASLAYYALFSLFPLTIFLVIVSSYFMGNENASLRTILFIRAIFPFSGDIVQNNLLEVQKQQATLSVVGVISMLWAASGFFSTLIHHINRAWPMVKLRSIVSNRLFAIGMIGSMVLLLFLSLVSTTVVNYLPNLILLFGEPYAWMFDAGVQAGLRVIPWLFTFLLFIAMYRWVPNKVVHWKAALPGALIITLVWELAKFLFTIYLKSGLSNFSLFYGSLEALVVLILWIYTSNFIALFGAYLVASLDLRLEEAHNRSMVAEPKSEPSFSKSIRG